MRYHIHGIGVALDAKTDDDAFEAFEYGASITVEAESEEEAQRKVWGILCMDITEIEEADE